VALRWGYLGAGGIADIIATDFGHAGLKIQAVATRDLARTNAFADKFNIPNRHPDYAALVADPEVDVIYISTVQTLHRDHALLAIEAGKHVLLEKPFTMNAADAHEIYAAAKRKNVFVMEAMWTRFLPTMTAVFAAIEADEIGTPHFVYADHSQFCQSNEHRAFGIANKAAAHITT
jgi:predicted dehydrogenase